MARPHKPDPRSDHRTPPPAAHGFVRTVAVNKVGESGLAVKISAAPGDLARVAEYLKLQAVRSLIADVELSRWRGKGIKLTGTFRADVVQTCVVTLDPVEAVVEGTFERRFLPQDQLSAELPDGHEVRVEMEDEDPAEPLAHDIDLGEILVEELSLNLDPYPRKPGVEFAPAEVAPAKAENPFAVLAKLAPKSSGKDKGPKEKP